jgi:hypothetical protein
MPDKVAAISLLVAKSTEVGKSKATKVIFFKKEYLVILKPAAIPSLQILVQSPNHLLPIRLF